MADAATITLKAVLLPDEIQTTLKDLTFSFTPSDANTATTDGSTTSDESIYVCFDGGTAAYNLGDAIEIGAGESWYGKLPNATVGDIHAISGDSGASSAGEASVQCMVVAILDDVA